MTQPALSSDFRRRFAEAAWKLGCARGASAVTVRALAEDLGVSAALLYAHFEDKASLLREVQHFVQPMLTASLAQAARTAEPDTRLFDLCLAYVEFMREHAWVYVATESKLDLGDPPRGHRSAFVEHAAALLGETDAALELSLRTLRSLHLWVGVHGLALVGWLGRGCGLPTDDDDFFVRMHIQMLVRGATAPATDASP